MMRTPLGQLVLLLCSAVALPTWSSAAEEPTKPAISAEQIACDALKVADLSESVGATVRVLEIGLLPARDDQPALCRVNGSIEPQVGFEVRLPVTTWNGKLLVTGCSNLCGSLQIEGMEDALARGYVAATTDMGHQSESMSDARWAYNNPALEADFGHRATHVTTLAAKQLVANYYGDPPDYSYFRGCSTGGRQALVAAERYPDDFNGIIAGAPFNQSLSVPHMAWAVAANTGADGKPVLNRAGMALLGKSALAACDAQDGRADGVIGDPQSCDFKPASLQCPAAVKSGDACLSAAEVEAATRIYAGPRSASGKNWSSGGAPLGSESSWAAALLAPPEKPGKDTAGESKPAFFSFIEQNWLQYLAFEPDPPLVQENETAPLAVNFEAGPTQFAATNDIVGFRPDLARFHDLGGRLIVYHGWADESLMPAHTLDYWRAVRRRLGGETLDEFARLFMVPGMRHCGGGPGAADIDYLSALERWVEADEAPASLLAHKVRSPVTTQQRQPRFPLAPGSVEFTQPVLPYQPAAPP